MRKFLTTFLALCACLCTTTAIACVDNTPNSSLSESSISLSEADSSISLDSSSEASSEASSAETSTSSSVSSESTSLGSSEEQSSSLEDSSQASLRTVTFTAGTGFTYANTNVANGASLPEGSTLTFSISLGAFYTGNPIAYVNGAPTAPKLDGTYEIPVGEEDITVRIEGVRKDISNMSGSGTMDDAFLVTKPIDLLYIAEQVNKGNSAYTKGSYILANDIDCKGEELKVIGDYSIEAAVFSGCFSCVTNSETGEMQRYTISNFTINSENSGYVGLFGAVFADMAVTSSGLFYGIRLDNFTINAGASKLTSESKTVTCGALIGYGVGANLYLCDATNGEINLTADQSYFSFAGGLIGYQQAYYEPTYDAYFPSEIAYASVDVDVNVLGGMALYAGGISGYVATNHPFGATASIHNSYALGSVNGALRSGGIAGGLGQYTVVSNCYATGNVSARSNSPIDDPLSTSTEYSYSYAGGLVGYAENDSIAHDCFFNGKASAHAVSGNSYAISNPIIAGGDEAGVYAIDSQKYLAIDCLYNVDLSDETYLTNTLGWQTYDWVLTSDALPTINYDAAEGVITMALTITFTAPDGTTILVNNQASLSKNYLDTSMQSNNSYVPIGTFLANESLDFYYEADNGYLSYGYFFDEACTQKVPYSYLPTKNVTLYVGFADPTPIIGTYYLTPENSTSTLELIFDNKGIVTYSDGVSKQKANYSFDGEQILIEEARLARYYLGEVVVDDSDTSIFADPNFDLYRYSYYNFFGKLDSEGIALYDGVYFTESAPLIARLSAARGEYYKKDASGTTYYAFYGDKTVIEWVGVNGEYNYEEVDGTPDIDLSALTPMDAFKGTWVKSASINKVYSFDGAGNWEYSYVVYERTSSGYSFSYQKKILDRASGTYSVEEDKIVFYQNGKEMTAYFNNDGFLQINGGAYSREYSFTGTWTGSGYDLILAGIGEDNIGVATLQYNDGFATKLVYEVSETSGVVALYYPHDDYVKDALYGYFIHDLATNTLTFVQYTGETESGYASESLYLNDDYYGEWICNVPALQNVEFDFNGFGLYTYMGLKGTITLTEDGEKTVVEYSLDSSLKGKFAYKGVMYEMEYDEDTQCIVLSLGADATLERKDEFAGVEFVDMDGNRYVFDGKSSLTIGGKLTVDDKVYSYFPDGENYAVFDGQTLVGSVVKGSNHFLLTIGEDETKLYIANEFMGDWAINNQYALFHIGPTDTNGVIQANFKGKDVELTYLDAATLTFFYREDKMPITYYVFVIPDESTEENVLVLSEFTNLAAGEYFICSKVNKLFGTWYWMGDNGKTTLRFDGVTSSYINGYAEQILKLNTITITTEYFYMFRDGGIVMWSRELMAERTWYFRLDFVAPEDMEEAAKSKDAYVLYDENGNIVNVLIRAEVDGLYLTKAFDEDENEYVFDGDGTLLVNDTAKYSYVIKAYNSNNTATLEVTDIETGKVYEATLDYRDSAYILFTLGDEIVNDEAEND